MRGASSPRIRRACLVVGVLALVGVGVVQVLRPAASRMGLGSDATYRLRILTWNVGRVFLPMDSLATESRASDEDLGHIARVVEETAPDVVALQELRGPLQLEGLVTLLGGTYEGRVPEEESYDRVVAVMARRPQGGDTLGYRTLVTSTGRATVGVSVPLGNLQRAFVVSVHLDAFSRERRRTQAEELVDWASRQPESEVFLCGDFNLDWEMLERHAEEHPDLQTYRILTGRFEDLGRSAGQTTFLGRRLDYIFARTSGVKAREVRVLAAKRRALMDHDPVVATFEVKRPEGMSSLAQRKSLRDAGAIPSSAPSRPLTLKDASQ